jgi:hypothetical protein
VLIVKILEIVCVVLILRMVLSAAMRLFNPRSPEPGRSRPRRYEQEPFDKKKADIVDGEFEEKNKGPR